MDTLILLYKYMFLEIKFLKLKIGVHIKSLLSCQILFQKGFFTKLQSY